MDYKKIKPPWWENNQFNPLENESCSENIKRVWHHYTEWEDANAGMYKTITGVERAKLLKEAIAFTGDNIEYGRYMQKVVALWPISCEHNLTAMCINRRAWIGHAACCLAINCPEDITREAWGHLTKNQRKLANAQADRAIMAWEYLRKRGENAKNSTENECLASFKGENFRNVQPVQQNIFEFLRGKR